MVCFSCFMRNVSTKCPMCRFNYKTMKSADAEPDYLPYVASEIAQQYFQPNEDIAFIDQWWVRLKNLIPDMLPVIEREVFRKWLYIGNIYGESINFERFCEAVSQNEACQDNIIDLDDDYAMCSRMYLTRMLVAYNEQHGDVYTDFIAAVNDFIQHEYDTQ